MGDMTDNNYYSHLLVCTNMWIEDCIKNAVLREIVGYENNLV